MSTCYRYALMILISMSHSQISFSKSSRPDHKKFKRLSLQQRRTLQSRIGDEALGLRFDRRLASRNRHRLYVVFYKNPGRRFPKKYRSIQRKNSLKVVSHFSRLNAQTLVSTRGPWKSRAQAKAVCAKLQRLPLVKTCVVDTPALRNSSELKVPAETPRMEPAPSPQPQACQLYKDTDDVHYDGISDFWAREAIGADLVDDEFNQMVARGEITYKTPTRICDLIGRNIDRLSPEEQKTLTPEKRELLTNSDHSESMKTLVAGDQVWNTPTVYHCSFLGKDQKLLNELLETHPSGPTLVNHSLGWGERDIKNFFPDPEEMKNVYWISSGGNQWGQHEGIQPVKEANAESNFFVAGSLTPLALPSWDSEESEGILVSVPSDRSNTVCPKSMERCTPTRSSSGAAGLLSHAVRSALDLFPHIQKATMRTLIQNTALRIPSSLHTPRLNGHGMLNSYGVWRKVVKLKKLCDKKPQVQKCITDVMSTAGALDEGPRPSQYQIYRLAPQCFGGQPAKDCGLRQRRLKTLRKMAFLHPRDGRLWKALACLQQKAEFPISAAGYLNINRNTQAKPLDYQNFEFQTFSVGRESLRGYPYLSPRLQQEVVDFASDFIPAYYPDSTPFLYPLALRNLGEKGVPLLSFGAQYTDPQLRSQYLDVAMELGAPALAVLQASYASANLAQKMDLLDRANALQPASVPWMRSLLRDPDPKVRSRARTFLEPQ